MASFTFSCSFAILAFRAFRIYVGIRESPQESGNPKIYGNAELQNGTVFESHFSSAAKFEHIFRVDFREMFLLKAARFYESRDTPIGGMFWSLHGVASKTKAGKGLSE